MRIQNILCAVDFSPHAERALRVAVRLARENNASLVVAHAYYIAATAYAIEAPFPPTVAQQIEADARLGLDDALRTARECGLEQVSGKLLAGVPWATIVDELASAPYDLCVIGTHGRTGLARFLLGSVAERIVRHAPCSVLTVRSDRDAPYHHLFVATDFSAGARAAVDAAPTFVAPTGTITVFHDIDVLSPYAGDLPDPARVRDIDARASAALDDAAHRLRAHADVPILTRFRLGVPAAQIIGAVDEDPTVDLVVTGSQGRTGIKRAILGSVAEKVVRHARCDVLVAR